MDIRDGLIDGVGNTPLIRLRKASEETGCTLVGKAGFLNPPAFLRSKDLPAPDWLPG